MGNACFTPASSSSYDALVKLVFWGGGTRYLEGKQLAGELMFEFPDRLVCHAASFYLGRPLPTLSIDDMLHVGETYFLLPLDQFSPSGTLTAASLACLSPAKPILAEAGQSPFEYVKGVDGRTVIKVLPEFMIRAMIGEDDHEGKKIGSVGDDGGGGGGGCLCSTPELQKHYARLVGSRDRPWSPKLETISEKKKKTSSLLKLEWI